LVYVRDVAFRFAQRLADILRLEPREFLEMVAHLLTEEPQQPTSLARIQVPPIRGIEGGPGRLDRGTDVVPGPGRHAGERSLRRGIEDVHGLVRRSGDGLP